MEETEVGSLYGSQATGARSSEPRRLARGEVVGRYVVVEELGAGGMGVVYSAYDPELDRRVALKLLNPRGGSSSKTSRGRARLIREAQALAKVNHANVVTVHDVGEHEGQVFLAMEYVAGVTLRTWIAKGPHPWPEVIEVLSAAGHGLMAAHAKDMTHRDFKPDNVMLTGEGRMRRVVVMDFGLATAPSIHEDPTDIEASTSSSLAASVNLDSLTRTGSVMGTPAYMAPEQHSGTADQHADQFSFCVTLYEALYGTRPFAGSTLPELLAAAIYGDLQPTPTATVPQWVREAVIRGLEADPKARWPTMAALIDALHDNPSRRRWLLAGAVGVVLTGAAVYGVGLIQDQRSRASCAREASALDDVWGTPQREAIERAFADSPLPYADDSWSRAEARLDEQVQSWAALRMSTCLARTYLDPRLRDVQDACFETRRRRVDNAVAVLSEPDADLIQRAVGVANIDTQPCADDRRLRTAPPLPADPMARLRQQQLRQDLDLGRALRRAGKFDDARTHQETLAEAAVQAGELHLAAAARLELGHNLLQLGHLAEGAKSIEDAYFEAKRLSFDSLAARAARRLVGAHGRDLADATTGRRWARHAQILIDPDEQPVEQGRLEVEQARLEFTAGNYAEAIELGGRALAFFESNRGSYATETLSAKEVLFATYDRAHRGDDAVRMAREVLQHRSEGLGALHPKTLGAHSNLAAALITTDELVDAEAHARASLASGTEPDLTAALHMENLALVFRQTGRLKEALDLSQTVLDIRREQLPKGHLQIAHTLVNRCLALFSAGQVDEIPALVGEALDIYIEQGGPQSPYLVSTYRLMGAVEITAGDYEAALESFGAAADAQARVLGPKHPGTITVRIEVAQAALEQGDYLRAIELCEPWIEEAKHRDDLDASVLIPLHAIHGRAQLVAGSPVLARTSLLAALELAPTSHFHVSWGPVMEIDLGRLRWKTTPDKEEAIADVEAALAKLKAQDDADPGEVKRAETWLLQTKR